MYVSKSEGANFWLEVLSDLQNRGVRDILICCIDGLKGFPNAIQSVFPNTRFQLCIVHQIRNSIKHVGSKHQKEFLRHLNAHVLDEVGIELVHLQFELQLLQQRFVSANRSDEVGERVLQPAQPDEACVVHLLV